MLEISIMIAVITGIVEAIKRATGLNTRYAPLLALVLGVLYAGFLGGWTGEMLFTGIVAGLSASGLYGNIKKAVGK